MRDKLVEQIEAGVRRKDGTRRRSKRQQQPASSKFSVFFSSTTAKVCLGALLFIVILHLGMEFYETTQLVSTSSGGLESTTDAESASFYDRLFNAAHSVPLHNTSQTNLANSRISPFSKPGYCINISTVPIDDLREAFPTKRFEVKLAIIFRV